MEPRHGGTTPTASPEAPIEARIGIRTLERIIDMAEHGIADVELGAVAAGIEGRRELVAFLERGVADAREALALARAALHLAQAEELAR